MAKKTSLCFVCVGNTCRSPMAQFILKNLLLEDGTMDLRVTSYGLNVSDNEINPIAKSVLKSHKIKMTKFVPKQITFDKVKGFDAIVAVTDDLMKGLIDMGYKNVYSINQLTKLGDIPDPYGGDVDRYDKCYRKLLDCCTVILSMLKQVL